MTSTKKLKSKMKEQTKKYVRLLILVLFCHASLAQDSTSNATLNKRRLRTVAYVGSAGYALTMTGLYQVWYRNSERQSFTFFNDNDEWKQADKLGHFYSSFYLSYGTQRALNWCGVRSDKSALIGAVTGFLVLLPIEILDGYSADYGASTGDLLANAGGAAFFFGQHKLWSEVRIHPKYSFHRTSFAPQRPEVLGENLIQEIVKDYNGQTQWLSFDLDKFIRFPAWLNVAIGYGAEEMVYARDYQNRQNNYFPYRQYYLALDPDLTAVKTKSKILRTVFFVANMIKIPAPAMEFSSRGMRFHAFYF